MRAAATLLDAVHADLDDDDARLVYADALLEAGDARGEFIVLQCTRGRGGEPTMRERSLLRMNARAWVGPAGSWLAPTLRYERGFLVAAAHGGKGASVAANAADDGVWMTLEELDMSKGTSDEVVFLSHPVLRSLHTLTGVLASDFVRIEGRSLRCVGLRRIDVQPSRVVTALAKHKLLVSLHLGEAPEPELMLIAAARLPHLRTISFKKRKFERNGAEWKETWAG